MKKTNYKRLMEMLIKDKAMLVELIADSPMMMENINQIYCCKLCPNHHLCNADVDRDCDNTNGPKERVKMWLNQEIEIAED